MRIGIGRLAVLSQLNFSMESKTDMFFHPIYQDPGGDCYWVGEHSRSIFSSKGSSQEPLPLFADLQWCQYVSRGIPSSEFRYNELKGAMIPKTPWIATVFFLQKSTTPN